MVIKPLGSNCLLKQLKEESVTKSGFILSGNKELPQATVIAVGEDATKIQVGQTVLLKSWGGEDVLIDREKFKVLDQNEILAIVE